MDYPLRLPDQLKPHLRALRKGRGLTQAQLGALVGVGQARIAEIEANPGAVSLDQLVKILAALGSTLHLHPTETGAAADSPAPRSPRQAVPPEVTPKAAGRSGRSAKADKPAQEPPKKRPTKSPSKPPNKPNTASAPTAPRAAVVIAAKKGVW